MTEHLPGPLISTGRTAEVYAWEEGTILKLYRDWCPRDWVEYEAKIAHAVNAAGASAPRAGEIVECNGRRGILYERVNGPSMLEMMNRQPLKIAYYGRMLGEIQSAMHRLTLTGDLPSMRVGLERSIQSAKALPDDLKARVLAALQKLPDDNRLCHGDFHPGNVLITERGPVIIDWMTAKLGSPWADVARTSLLLTIGDVEGSPVSRWLLTFGRNTYYQSYLNRYLALNPQGREQIAAWMPILAAARLNEEIQPEREKLLKIIREGLVG